MQWIADFRALADLILPRVCIVCGRELGPQERLVCPKCAGDVPRTFYWLRERNPMADRLNSLITDGPYLRAVALFFYNPESGYSNITKSLKYRRNFAVGKHFSAILGGYLAGSPLFNDVDTVIPVPLHWTRRWKRGYNQAETIAKGIALSLDAALATDILRRTRRTGQQARLKHSRRSENMKDAFSASLSGYKDAHFRHILLVDDVFTTGVTLFECCRALRKILPPDVRISVATLGFAGEG